MLEIFSETAHETTVGSVRDLVCGLTRTAYHEVAITVLRAFIDDSGSGGGSTWYVLAGYVGTVEGWDPFDAKWEAVLHSDPAIDYFKSSEAESLRRDGRWAGISKEQRDLKIDSLIGVIRDCAQRAVIVRMRTSLYDEILKGYVPPPWGDPYHFLFYTFISAAVTSEIYGGGGEPIEFVFDSNERLEKTSLLLYDQMLGYQKWPNQIVNVLYRDDKKFLPLQAADLLAWQSRRRLCSVEPTRNHYKMATTSLREKPFTHILSRETLIRLRANGNAVAKQRWAALGLPEDTRPYKL